MKKMKHILSYILRHYFNYTQMVDMLVVKKICRFNYWLSIYYSEYRRLE